MNRNTTRRPTLGQVVRRVVLTSIVTGAIAGAAFATVAVLVDQATLDMTYGSSSSISVDSDTPDPTAIDPADDVQQLVEQHDCWAGAADMPNDMQGQLPGHVVVSTAASPATPTYSANLVGPALDTVFGAGDGDSGLAVHAFCR